MKTSSDGCPSVARATASSTTVVNTYTESAPRTIDAVPNRDTMRPLSTAATPIAPARAPNTIGKRSSLSRARPTIASDDPR